MLANGSALYKFLDPIFEAEGFQRKKDTWYRHTPECICFFYLKKSPYGGGRFDNFMGCFVKRVYGRDELFPPYNEKNIDFGLGEMMNPDWVKQAFDLEDVFFECEERETRLRELMEKYAIPFLKGMGSEDGIRKMAKKYKDLKYSMDINTREALGIKK